MYVFPVARTLPLQTLLQLELLLRDGDCATELGLRGGHAALAALAGSADAEVAEVRTSESHQSSWYQRTQYTWQRAPLTLD
jgi:hypothetical protein